MSIALWLSSGGAELPLAMLLVFVAAKLLAEAFERLQLPALAGEILAGVLLGPGLLGWVSDNAVLHTLGEIGMIFFLFRLGLEVNRSQLTRPGLDAGMTAALAAALPFGAGFAVFRLWGGSTIEALVVATALSASSVGITGQFLVSRGLDKLAVSRIVIFAAVIDDVAGLIVLAFIGSLRESSNIVQIVLASLLGIALLLMLSGWGAPGAKKVVPRVKKNLRVAEAEFALAMTLLFGLAVLAVRAGVAAAIGAFLAGVMLSENVERRVHVSVQGVSELLAPFFLVGVGMQLHLPLLAQPAWLALLAIVAGTAIFSKFVGGALGAGRLGFRSSLRCGCGLVPRGAVAVVAAKVAVSSGMISMELYTVLIATVMATALLSPLLLRAGYRGLVSPHGPARDVYRLG